MNFHFYCLLVQDFCHKSFQFSKFLRFELDICELANSKDNSIFKMPSANVASQKFLWYNSIKNQSKIQMKTFMLSVKSISIATSESHFVRNFNLHESKTFRTNREKNFFFGTIWVIIGILHSHHILSRGRTKKCNIISKYLRSKVSSKMQRYLFYLTK